MTLLLGALTSEAIVLGADGAEFRYTPNKPKHLDVLNRTKLFPVQEQAIAVGIHGQNRLISHGCDINSQWLAIDVLPKMIQKIDVNQTVAGLCQYLFDLLTSDVIYTFETLSSANIQAAPMGILVVGFDNSTKFPQCYEAWWPLLHEPDQARVIRHPRDQCIPAVIHSGNGASFARKVISHGGRYSVDRLNKSTLEMTQEYVRSLYKKAEKLQIQDRIEFGGNYHELTVTRDKVEWSQGILPNKMLNPTENKPVS